MAKKDAPPKATELENYFKKYQDVNAECIVKADLLTTGIRFTGPALEAAKGHKRKTYYLFSFDRTKIDDMTQQEHLLAPEDMALTGGPYGLRRTVVQSRVNAQSPYCVDVADGKVVLRAGGEVIADVEYAREVRSDHVLLSDGTRCTDVTPVHGWNWMANTCVLRSCQFWGNKEECKFCDMNANVRQQRNAGKTYIVHKSVEQVAEAHERIFKTDRDADPELIPHTILITGGIVARAIQEKAELQFYLDYVRAIRERIGHRIPLVLQTSAQTKDDCKRMKDAGVNVHHANLEVWDKRLFGIICPGKAKLVGWENWVTRLVDSVDVFGESNVCPNLVVGVEMAKPWGFNDVDEALGSTLQGIDYLMAHGVIPRITPWFVEPLSALAGQEAPPLDYHIRMARGWYELLKKHRLEPPRALSPFGPGKSTYPTSYWFDIE